MQYQIMRKNDIVTTADFDNDGHMLSYDANNIQKEIAPLDGCRMTNWLKQWWNDRSVPIGQGNLGKMLKENGCATPEGYLIKNLGLSLTDYYWIRPVDSVLTWEQVNLFENNFKENRLYETDKTERMGKTIAYSPNGSLQGNIEKTWAIIEGKRCLIKGNHNDMSCESINEVIASRIHALQGYDNYTPYKLIHIKGKEYAYGCISELFTSQKKELVSAYAVEESVKRPNNYSYMEWLIQVAGEHGMDKEKFRHDLNYEIMTDFLLSQYDRHLTNIAILRNADTLQFERMAPIFDSGGCLFATRALPRTTNDLLDLSTNGFCSKESRLIRSLKEYDAVDLTKLPPASFVREMYEMDEKIDKTRIDRVAWAYETKIDLCRNLQLGRDIYARRHSILVQPLAAQIANAEKARDNTRMTYPELFHSQHKIKDGEH